LNSQDKALTATAAALLAVAVFSTAASPFVCLTSAVCALALSLYLRHRGAFRDDNTPLVGALLIGGSTMMVLAGIAVASLRAALIVMGVVLVPILLFLMAFGIRERWRALLRRIEPKPRDDEKPSR
jgi:hypothetical protein